ncbi:MAG: M3 family oligoendopeptidase [Pseudomonadota bacterium]
MSDHLFSSRLALASAENSASAAQPDLGEMPVWALSDLYASPSAPEVERDLDRAQTDARALRENYEGKLEELAKGGEGLRAAVKDYEALADLLGRLGSYAGLLYAQNTADPDRAKFYGDIQEKLTSISSELIFFELEINRIDDAVLDAAISTGELARYQPWFADLRKEKPFQLSDDLEKVFHEKSTTGRGAFNRLFNETMTALRFEVYGEELAIEPTLNLLSDPEPKKRAAAANALADVFSENIRLFTLITNTLAKDKEISDRWRGFEDVAASRHLSNRVEAPVVDALVEAVRAKYPVLSHRYYALKAKWLGQDKLAHWDRNAPLPEASDKLIEWPQARRTVMDAYRAFSPDLAKVAEPFFNSGWIDAPVRDGKAPGAFSHPTVPSAHPFILLNYMGKPRDVMTLAHELGHGVHQVLANDQGPLLAPTPLTLAETASVFGEMLTFRALLDEAGDGPARKAMLAQKVEDMINTVVRQIAFYSFERKVHEARREGELTSDQLGDLWMEVQRDSLGPSVDLRPGYETYWSYIPHFIHSPFYVYAYAFGDCLVNSLYAVYEDAEEGFAEKYLDMLRAGGSKHHSELLAPFGLNASDPDFWSMGLGVIERLIDELEAMEG